ncbi:helix-turn-helix transcriptional regulator [Clostridiaceae bacterium UIB06]|uniref:Helix-turn-helix transcriptional regulator n=1 Tax=Clostridium thailandense TaxID=2794346 RepID=A0A949TXU4_9CLOT|nr:XRE family transcriptional regulator [Clostridium thailandense]MBV7273841.1 helix-turn-helix transcriptional regulator [Clostridium thailandense]MCH5136894.1 helix-turn-helix transcriptional regulator [Clostridiaceae bacterium UIB06]
MNISLIIAENLKRLRNERNLSLSQLAELSDISKVMLSQIEKGETNPTINTIWKIAAGLNVPYTSLLEQQKQDAYVIKKSDIVSQLTDDGQYRLYCYYSNTPHRNFELFQMELDEGCKYTSVGHPEKSEEYLMVLEGQLTLEVNNETFILYADDTITFTASAKHIYFNSGKGILKTAIINFYPV